MTDASAEHASAAFGRRAAALLAASSPHLPRVVDVTVLGERRELILDEADGPTLGAVLAQRRRLTPGESTTVVIAAARALSALHEAGYCGVMLGDEDLRFDRRGTPMLQGLDRLRETMLAGQTGAADDWRALAALADRLGIVAHGRTAGALGPAQLGLGLALATLTAEESPQNLDRLEDAMFELADPRPVQLDGERWTGREVAAPPLGRRSRAAAHRRPSGSVLIEAFEAGPAALLAQPIARVRSRLGEFAGRLHGRARLLLIAGAAAAAITLTAVVLLPQRSSPSSAAVTTPAVVSSPHEPQARAAHATPTATPGSGDDPVAAAGTLLAARDGCLAFDGVARRSCLAAIADGDVDLGRPARPLASLVPSLVERTGDSALVALTPQDAQTAPASALLMRTEAGWRLRQLYEN